MSCLRAFLIGSSYPVLLPFLLSVRYSYSQSEKNYSYQDYSLVAPAFLGTCNVISLAIANSLDLSLRQRCLTGAALSAAVVCVYARTSGSYNYSEQEWLRYYTYISFNHFIVWNIVIYYLELYV